MFEIAADSREAEEVPDVASDKRVGEKHHTVDSRHFRNEDDMEVLPWKRKGVRRDGPIVVNAATDVDVDRVVGDTVSDGMSIANDRNHIGCDI